VTIATNKTLERGYAIKPQPGSQEAFLSTSADIAVYGGAAGAGKSWGLLMEPLRHIGNKGFGTVIFRRTYPQITNEGGLWDTSSEIYPHLPDSCRAKPKLSTLEWVFPSGCKIKFAHMQHENDRYEWDGAQITLLGFDQLEHFTWKMFFYMLSRNRSLCGVNPYIRATCNPDPDHWLREFMRWWIDEETGLPIDERSGVIRWFVIVNDEVHWADKREELVEKFGGDIEIDEGGRIKRILPKSFTFIPGKVYDNQILLQQNPEYLANLQALSKVDRGRLLEGNWNVRESAGMFFRREWFEIVEAAPALVDEVRYWDRAATEAKPGQKAKGSWTAGLRMGKDARGVYYIKDVSRFQASPLGVESNIKNVASQDGKQIRVGLEQDPGQAGKAEVQVHVRNLAGFNVAVNTVRESKGTRAKPLSAQVEAGNVKLVRGVWNETFIREAENFDGTDKCVSDQVDGASGAFCLLTSFKTAGTWGR